MDVKFVVNKDMNVRLVDVEFNTKYISIRPIGDRHSFSLGCLIELHLF